MSFDDPKFDRDVSFKETTLMRTTLSFRQSQFISGTLRFTAARNEGSILVFDKGTKSASGKIDVNRVHDGPLLLSGPEPPGLILGSVSRSEGFPSLRRRRRRRDGDSPVPHQYT